MRPAPRHVIKALLTAATGLVAATGVLAQARPGGDWALGEYLAGECVTCHRLSAPAGAGIPSIIAWPDDQFVAVLKSYRLGDRDSPVMQTIAGRLSEDEMAALAAYFGSLAPRPANP
ncbi:MAG: c-type cytochrome [Phreatobacter sp.]